jgi:hypothetical protein
MKGSGKDLEPENNAMMVYQWTVLKSFPCMPMKVMCVSPKTIEKHRSSISSKLGILGRLEMLKYAIKIGIVNPELWDS